MADQTHTAEAERGGNTQGTVRATTRAVDVPMLLALAAILIGWFLLDTLSMSYGVVRLDFHFYQFAAIIAQPARLLRGIDTASDLWTLPFTLLCLASLAAALLQGQLRLPGSRFGYLAPLLLMLVCGGILYYETSRDTFTAAVAGNQVTDTLINLGNLMVRRAGTLVAKRISVGAGMWVSAAGALYLAWAGWRRNASQPSVSVT
jgi:hypothetical protein